MEEACKVCMDFDDAAQHLITLPQPFGYCQRILALPKPKRREHNGNRHKLFRDNYGRVKILSVFSQGFQYLYVSMHAYNA